MSLVVIEGLDGSGKSTQIKKVREYLEKKNVPYRYIHFPRTETGIFGDLVARFLRGDLGKINEVNPYLVALIYAGDRHDASKKIINWLKKGYFVLLDRYVYSNIAFQCAKIEDRKRKLELAEWILHLEYNYYMIPKPDFSLYLDVPFDFIVKQLTDDRSGTDRAYLQGNKDIHEDDLEFQGKVKEMYDWQVYHYHDFTRIDCKENDNEMLMPSEIFDKIYEKIKFCPEISGQK